MNNNEVVAIVLEAVAAVFALSLLMRFVLLSEYGVPGGWMYFGLPIGGIGLVVVLPRLGLLNFAGRSAGTIQPWHYNSGMPTPPIHVAIATRHADRACATSGSGMTELS